MARNYYEPNYQSGSGFLGALLIGALVGAAAVFFSDDRNKRRLKATIEDWKNKAEDVREAGLEKVSDELERTQKKVDGQRKATRG